MGRLGSEGSVVDRSRECVRGLPFTRCAHAIMCVPEKHPQTQVGGGRKGLGTSGLSCLACSGPQHPRGAPAEAGNVGEGSWSGSWGKCCGLEPHVRLPPSLEDSRTSAELI